MAEDAQQQPKPRMNPQDYRNQDLVNKLMAATPSYLYSPTMGQHNFFFSEMLRSLVQNKRNENMMGIRNHLEPTHPPQHVLQPPQTIHAGRRPRKRSWSQQRIHSEIPKEITKEEEVIPVDKPLELTSKHSEYPRKHFSKLTTDTKSIIGSELVPNSLNEFNKNKSPSPDISNSSNPNTLRPVLDTVGPTTSAPQTDLILPPPPPVWYPPLYPPYGIDPLHFFIDLRVSGHIYDRKKEILAQSLKNENTAILNSHENISKNRLGSAFSVPKPRTESKNTLAMNLSNNSSEKFRNRVYNNELQTLYENSAELKENSLSRKNTNYVMQNLPRIYSDLNTHKDNELEDGKINSSLMTEEQRTITPKSDRNYEEENNNYHNLVSDDETIAVDEN